CPLRPRRAAGAGRLRSCLQVVGTPCDVRTRRYGRSILEGDPHQGAPGMKLTDITKIMDPTALLRSTTQAITGQAVEAILAQLPPLDELPYDEKLMKGNRPAKEVTDLADRIRVSMRQEGKGKDYTLLVEDDGIGQTAVRMHETLLSLGCSDKPDKPYLIGMFG